MMNLRIWLWLWLWFVPFHNDAFHFSQQKQQRNSVVALQLVDKGWNILETANQVIPQRLLVQTAKESWKFGWKTLMTELAPQDKSGSYVRPQYKSSSTPELKKDLNRYHLYVGNPCPWCHRVRLALALTKTSFNNIGVTVLVDDPTKASRGGWIMDSTKTRKNGLDPLGCNDLRELYDKVSNGNYKGRCTAPLLIDLKSKTIVSNESSDICKMINELSSTNNDDAAIDLRPTELVTTIDETNEWIYKLINNGVYRCGFSTQQKAYDAASKDVRSGLDKVNSILQTQPYLCGNVFTESDLYLLPTILRFDGAYAPLFRAGGSHLRIRSDYPIVLKWLQRCWDMEGVQETIDLQDATTSYYKQLFPLNPSGIIPTPITANEIGLN